MLLEQRFISAISQALPRLVSALHSDLIRSHPRWGQAIPYRSGNFGEGDSLAYCVRPDIVISKSGPRIVELNFFPAGRGILLSSPAPETEDATEVFREWYRKVDREEILYAVGSNSIWLPEISYFCERLREERVEAVNIDQVKREGAVVDRMFQRCQLENPEPEVGEIFIKEGWLDSKAILALVHDPLMTETLEQLVGEEHLRSLREFIPITSLPSTEEVETIIESPADYIVKNSEVDTLSTFGSRGVRQAKHLSAEQIRKIFSGELSGVDVGNGFRKEFGRYPVAQRFEPSEDLRPFLSELHPCDLSRFGLTQGTPPDTHLHGRVSFFALWTRGDEEALIPPLGAVVLRGNPIVHGAGDCQSFTFALPQ